MANQLPPDFGKKTQKDIAKSRNQRWFEVRIEGDTKSPPERQNLFHISGALPDDIYTELMAFLGQRLSAGRLGK
jgi:hypothetical protein